MAILICLALTAAILATRWQAQRVIAHEFHDGFDFPRALTRARVLKLPGVTRIDELFEERRITVHLAWWAPRRSIAIFLDERASVALEVKLVGGLPW